MSILPKNADAIVTHSLTTFSPKNERLSCTFSSTTVDWIGCLSYPFRTTHQMSDSYAHSKRVALRNVKGSRLACQCSLKPVA